MHGTTLLASARVPGNFPEPCTVPPIWPNRLGRAYGNSGHLDRIHRPTLRRCVHLQAVTLPWLKRYWLKIMLADSAGRQVQGRAKVVELIEGSRAAG
jgi:hypothetical protein